MRDLIPLFVTILSGYRKIFKIKFKSLCLLTQKNFFGVETFTIPV